MHLPLGEQVSSIRIALTRTARGVTARTPGEPGAGLRDGECAGSGRHREGLVRTGRYRPEVAGARVPSPNPCPGSDPRFRSWLRGEVPASCPIRAWVWVLRTSWGDQVSATAIHPGLGESQSRVGFSRRTALGGGRGVPGDLLRALARRDLLAGAGSLSDPSSLPWRDFSRQPADAAIEGREMVPALWVLTVKEAKPKTRENPPSELVRQPAKQNALETYGGTGACALWEGVPGAFQRTGGGGWMSHVVGWPCLTPESSMSVFQFRTAPPWVCHLEKIYLAIRASDFSVNVNTFN